MKQPLIAVMQPTLFPWAGYFDLIDQSKIFVLYNDVQFSKQSWQTRNRISTPNGIMLISIPTLKCDLHTNIENVYLDSKKDWNKKFLKTLQLNYTKAKYFNEVIDWISNFLNREFEKLQEFNISFISQVSKKIGIDTTLKYSSELNLKNTDRVDRLIEISELHHCPIYLSTTGSFGYLDEENANERFNAKNMDVIFHHYSPTKYETGKLPYEPYMSIIDVLFHCGFEDTLSIIRAGRKPNYTFEEYKNLQHG